MLAALPIQKELSANELRTLARREGKGRAAARMLAIAHALDGMSRAEAARLAGVEHQVLCDTVAHDNAEGVAGLYDRPLPLSAGMAERGRAGNAQGHHPLVPT